MAADVGIKKLAPRNKATVMILGNHSSGKSSFINCEDNLVFFTIRVFEGEYTTHWCCSRE